VSEYSTRTRAQKARDTTPDYEKLNWPRRRAVCIDAVCVVVTALCNQPEAFTSDLGDDQSRYLWY